MVLLQLAGLKLATSALELPPATTTVVPRDTALLIAFWYAAAHRPLPPRLMLMTLAGVGFAGTRATLPPDAQVIASTMSDVRPPHLPSTRTGRILAFGAIPATPTPLLLSAAIVPATWVPCQLEFDGVVSP